MSDAEAPRGRSGPVAHRQEAQAAPDWETGGTGITQRAVGERSSSSPHPLRADVTDSPANERLHHCETEREMEKQQMRDSERVRSGYI